MQFFADGHYEQATSGAARRYVFVATGAARACRDGRYLDGYAGQAVESVTFPEIDSCLTHPCSPIIASIVGLDGLLPEPTLLAGTALSETKKLQ